MNRTPSSQDAPAPAGREEIISSLFAGMVVQQTNMALMLLGRTPHPETGQTLRDLESARMFIDQLEMLEVKTRGNLDQQEEKLLKQSLMALRMAFVEAVESPAAQPSTAPSPAANDPSESPHRAGPSEAPGQPDAASPEDESRKKFSKKY